MLPAHEKESAQDTPAGKASISGAENREAVISPDRTGFRVRPLRAMTIYLPMSRKNPFTGLILLLFMTVAVRPDNIEVDKQQNEAGCKQRQGNRKASDQALLPGFQRISHNQACGKEYRFAPGYPDNR